MFRMLFLTFWGSFRGTHEQEHHLHESPKSMTIPLMVLAALSVVGGLLGLPEFWHQTNWIGEHLSPIILHKDFTTLSHDTEWTLMGIAVASACAVIYFAHSMFITNKVLPVDSEDKLKPWQKLVANKYYVDEFYDAVIRKPLDVISTAFYKFFDLQIIDGIVNSVGNAVTGIGSGIRLLQTGNIGFYVVSMVLGVVLILLFTFII